jgi:hypothetical protein
VLPPSLFPEDGFVRSVFKVIAALLLLPGFGFLTAVAEGPAPSSGTVVVTSSPSGARVALDGRIKVAGVTPFTIRGLPLGRYDIRSREPGYAVSGGAVEVQPLSHARVAVEMRQKGRLGALTRSLLFPGWGQAYGERDGARIVYQAGMGLAALVGGAAGINYALDRRDFDDAEDEYRAAINRGDAGDDEWRKMQRAHRDLQRSADTTEYAGFAVAGLWLLNVLDSVVLFPHFDALPMGENYSLNLKADDGLRLELARAIR